MFTVQKFRQKTLVCIIHVMETLGNEIHRLNYGSLRFSINPCFVYSGGGNTLSVFVRVSLRTWFFSYRKVGTFLMVTSAEVHGDPWYIVLQAHGATVRGKFI